MERTGIERYLHNIWPTIYKIINGFYYFMLNLIRTTVKKSIEQIRNNG